MTKSIYLDQHEQWIRTAYKKALSKSSRISATAKLSSRKRRERDARSAPFYAISESKDYFLLNDRPAREMNSEESSCTVRMTVEGENSCEIPQILSIIHRTE